MKLKLLFLALLLAATVAGLFAQQPVQPVAGVLTLNLGQGINSFKTTLSANVTSVVFLTQGGGTTATVIFTENSTGGFTVAFGGNISNPCTVTTTANATTVCQFTYDGNSNTWIGASGSSSGGGAGSANLVDPTTFGAKADGLIYADGTSSGSSNLFSSAHINCNPATDPGRQLVAVNPSITTLNWLYGTTVAANTVQSCSGNAWVMPGNGSATVSGTADWVLATDSGSALANAYQAAILNSKILAQPCGVLLVSVPPFQATATSNPVQNRPDIEGCNNTMGTIFVLHPAITSGVLAAGGNIFLQDAFNTLPGTILWNGLGGQRKVSNIFLTSINGLLPGTAGKVYTILGGTVGFASAQNITAMGLGLQAGTLWTVNLQGGEGYGNRLNLQAYAPSAAVNQYIGVQISGQGANTVSNSIFANSNLDGIVVNGGVNAISENNYFATIHSGVSTTGSGNFVTIIGNECILASSSGSACIADLGGNNTTIYAFGNPILQSQIASFAPIQLGANSLLDISGSKIVSLTSGFNITGSATSTLNDRAGNSFSSPLTQYTGTVNFIGGGSMVNTPIPVSTNFGVAIGSTNAIASVISTTPMGVYVDLRQITLGVGCGAGSNTAQATVSYTLPGGTAASQTSSTLTIAANGTVDTDAGAKELTFTAKVGTAITYSVASTLVSAGCSTVPQYQLDIKGGTN